MLTKTIAAAAVQLGLAVAACQTFSDNFDDTSLLEGIIPELSPVATSSPNPMRYHALDYISGPGQLIVKFPSAPNVIGAGSLSIPREGHMPSWNLKADSEFQTFNQKSIAFVCVTNLQNSVSPPTACNMQAAGRKSDGSFVYHSLIFNPGPNQDIPGNFSTTTFPDTFTDLVEMNMAIVYTDQPEIAVAMIFDDNEYEACN
ncbi:hypothetical protein MBLNU230_g7599t1 [Neophaeotheca triangularis]